MCASVFLSLSLSVSLAAYVSMCVGSAIQLLMVILLGRLESWTILFRQRLELEKFDSVRIWIAHVIKLPGCPLGWGKPLQRAVRNQKVFDVIQHTLQRQQRPCMS